MYGVYANSARVNWSPMRIFNDEIKSVPLSELAAARADRYTQHHWILLADVSLFPIHRKQV